MSVVVGLIVAAVVFLPAAWLLVKRYERHLDAQMGPWIASELTVHRRRPRLMRQRADDSNR
jgi:hypothetical protein